MISVLIGLLALAQERASADTIESPGETVQLLTITAFSVSAVNLGLLVFPPHGSKVAGVVGVASGIALTVATHLDDSFERAADERTVYYGFGIGCAALGLIDYFAANNGPDHAIYGMHIDPSLRSFDNQHWLGLQLSSSW